MFFILYRIWNSTEGYKFRAMISMEVQSTVHIQHLNHSHGLSSLQSQHQSGLMHPHQLQDEKPPKSMFNLILFGLVYFYRILGQTHGLVFPIWFVGWIIRNIEIEISTYKSYLYICLPYAVQFVNKNKRGKKKKYIFQQDRPMLLLF